MTIEREFLESLSPVELDMISAFLSERLDASVNPSTEHYENLLPEVKCCPHCGSVHIVKNGFNKSIRPGGVKRQKYRCKDCRSVFVPTTGTIFRNTTTSYETWIRFIKCEINGMTLVQEAEETGLSKTTCFAMRHKLYNAVGKETEQLQGLIQLDPTYLNIRLKGTKTTNMPRKSKKRGKGKTPEGELSGLSKHKVCIISAVDDTDHFLFRIAGIGVESRKLLDPFSACFQKGSEVVIDEKRCLESFVKDNGMRADIIPSAGFKSDKGRTLADLNQLHQELSELIVKKHGVSLRHLQGYLNWLVFCKQLKYRFEVACRNTQTYIHVMLEQVPFTIRNLCTIALPVDLSLAFGEDGMITQVG